LQGYGPRGRKPGSQGKSVTRLRATGQEGGSPGVKVKALQGCGPRRSPGITSQTPRSVKKCEGV